MLEGDASGPEDATGFAADAPLTRNTSAVTEEATWLLSSLRIVLLDALVVARFTGVLDQLSAAAPQLRSVLWLANAGVQNDVSSTFAPCLTDVPADVSRKSAGDSSLASASLPRSWPGDVSAIPA